MKLLNDTDRIKKDVLVHLIKAFDDSSLAQTVDKIPIIMRPRNMEASRCCTYKDRAVLKYRMMAALGFGIEDETDETVPLRTYAEKSLQREHVSEKNISVLDVACEGCVDERYVITTSCHGCLARPCMNNCPKNAIEVHNSQAKIDHEKCIDCGKCMQVCPFHAIIRVPIPCEEACPVDAICRTPSGKQEIDFTKCTSCGKCVAACPFGAVLERSHIIDVLNKIKLGAKVIPMVAPSVIGQFNGSLHQIAEALQQLGFSKMAEVAFGAEETSKNEAKEFLQTHGSRRTLNDDILLSGFYGNSKTSRPEISPIFIASSYSDEILCR